MSPTEQEHDGLVETEYQDLLKKITDHEAEIKEAEELLHLQKMKHEVDKQKMIEHFNTETTSMQRLINNERTSMEKTMQNLINEIVRLKEERNDIRKNTRIEKEKLLSAFEDERVALLSNNEVMKNEVEEKFEKKFQEEVEKGKKDMRIREAELEEELLKLKKERSDLVNIVKLFYGFLSFK